MVCCDAKRIFGSAAFVAGVLRVAFSAMQVYVFSFGGGGGASSEIVHLCLLGGSSFVLKGLTVAIRFLSVLCGSWSAFSGFFGVRQLVGFGS